MDGRAGAGMVIVCHCQGLRDVSSIFYFECSYAYTCRYCMHDTMFRLYIPMDILHAHVCTTKCSISMPPHTHAALHIALLFIMQTACPAKMAEQRERRLWVGWS